MRVMCPKRGMPGSLRSYWKGEGHTRPYYRIEHKLRNLKTHRHYLPLMQALSLLAVGACQNKNHTTPPQRLRTP
jgi:hypothetical protein